MDLTPSRKELVTQKVNEALEENPFGTVRVTGSLTMGSLVLIWALRSLLVLGGAHGLASGTLGCGTLSVLAVIAIAGSIHLGRRHLQKHLRDDINLEHFERPRLEDQQFAEKQTENIISAAKKRTTLLERRIENLRQLVTQADKLVEKYKDENGLKKKVEQALKPQRERVGEKIEETKQLIQKLQEQMAIAETCLYTIAVNAEFESINENPFGGSQTKDGDFEEQIARALDELKAIATEIDESSK